MAKQADNKTPIEIRDENIAMVIAAPEVTNAVTADAAGGLLMQVKSVIRQIDDARFRITRPLDDAKSEAIEQANKAKEPFVEAQKRIESSLEQWNIAERARIAAERADAEAERAELESAAVRAAEEGRIGEAAELAERASIVSAEEKVYRARGTQMRYRWKGEVVDLNAFIKAVAQNPMLPSGLLEVNQSALNQLASQYKGSVEIPGVKWFEQASIASTSRA